MSRASTIPERMEQVKESYYVLWNGRKVPQPVTKVTDAYFEVKGNRGGHYRFFTHGGKRGPYLTNLNSGRDYDVDEFRIVPE